MGLGRYVTSVDSAIRNSTLNHSTAFRLHISVLNNFVLLLVSPLGLPLESRPTRERMSNKKHGYQIVLVQ
jgi:hypothetical protein